MERESEVIQQRINATRASLAEKIEQLSATVGDRIETAAGAAGQTIEVVNDAVQAVKTGVDSVRESCNVTKQVEKRPWTMLAGATALAFVGSSMQHRRSVCRTASPQPERSSAAMRQARPEVMPEPRSMAQPERSSAAMRKARPEVMPEPRTTPQPGPAKPRGGALGVMFQGEIAQLRGLALGMLFGVLRDVVKDSVSKPMAQQVDEVIEGLATRMGGRPFNGRILPERKRPVPIRVSDEPETAVPPEA